MNRKILHKELDKYLDKVEKLENSHFYIFTDYIKQGKIYIEKFNELLETEAINYLYCKKDIKGIK